MKLLYYQDPVGNFGDDLNPWLWERLLPRPLTECFDEETGFLGIGTILNQGIPAWPPKKVVFSSGAGYGTPPTITKDWTFYCVRGRRTAAALGLPEETAITDGALLVRQLVAPLGIEQHQVAFMPHHRTAQSVEWQSFCDSIGVHYLDPAAHVEATIDGIRRSALVIAEAMHGAIVADALRVPWMPVRTSPNILAFKWHDWSESVGILHKFEWLPSVRPAELDAGRPYYVTPGAPVCLQDEMRSRLLWLARYGKRRLSSEAVFRDVYERLLAALHRMIDAIEQGRLLHG